VSGTGYRANLVDDARQRREGERHRAHRAAWPRVRGVG
jgi:hypothetical protein